MRRQARIRPPVRPVSARGQLQQRERVTAGFSDDPVTRLLGVIPRSQLDRVGLPDGRVAV
jgi:hypothetical protein